MPGGSDGSPGYWVVVLVLCLLAVPLIFSIGMPLLLLAITLAAVAPWRTQRALLWPAVTAVVAFVAGYLLVAPLGCSTSASVVDSKLLPHGSEVEAQSTSCSSVLGIDYSGAGAYNPSLLPALVAGLALSVLAAGVVRVLLKRIDDGGRPVQDAS